MNYPETAGINTNLIPPYELSEYQFCYVSIRHPVSPYVSREDKLACNPTKN
jgi:hypothetical protein